MNSRTKEISHLTIDAKERVTIKIKETVIVAPKENEEASRELVNKYTVKNEFKPRKEFLEDFLKLRKFALELAEFTEDKTSFTVKTIEIKGSMAMQTARVQFVLNKYVKRTGMNIEIKTPETVLFGDDYKNSKELVKAIEVVIERAEGYMNGENGEDLQLAFDFTTTEPEEAEEA